MKLEVGMYARTKDGEIIKIKYVENVYTSDDNTFIATVVYFGESFYVNSDDVKKASHNIKELLQVGDIITYEFPTGLGMLKYENVTILESLLESLKSNDEYTILSIVTKEQFEQMQYKVGE